MSAYVKLTSDQLRRLGDFLDGLTKLRGETGIEPIAYGDELHCAIDANIIDVSFDSDLDAFVVDERVGR